MFKRAIQAVGNPFAFILYAFPLFVCYYLVDTYLPANGSGPQPLLETALLLVYRLLLFPFILAGVYGGIWERLRQPGEMGAGGFLRNARRYYWPLTAATFAYWMLTLLLSSPFMALPASQADTAITYAQAALAPVGLFWLAAIVAEGGVFKGLLRGLRLLLLNPPGLLIGVAWALVCFADVKVSDLLIGPEFTILRLADAAVVAGARVLATLYLLAIYRQVRAAALEAHEAALAIPAEAQSAGSNTLINASFGFAFVSFLPLVNFVSLVLGILAIRRNKRFVMRSAIAIAAGAFFTVFYAYLVAALLISSGSPSREPSYSFLAGSDPALAQQVDLLEQNTSESSSEALTQLSAIGAGANGQHWAVASAIAIAKWQSNDLDGALEGFGSAALQNPDRGEFYYYYGRALLQKDLQAQAAVQFHEASRHGSGLEIADRYAELLDTAYTPPQIITIAFTIIILLILFTVHEYGHAFAAWKLGDDTARLQGRLTLSPIAHLDLFGSIILPGILLWRGSPVIFGWARPVPVNPANFKDPRRDHMRVSFAGPAVNIAVALLCFVILGGTAILLRLLWPDSLSWNFAWPYGPLALTGVPLSHELIIALTFIKQLMYTSLALGVFNLLPIPPLDGSWILAGLLPERARGAFEQFRRFGFILFLLIAWTPVLDYYVQIPVAALAGGLQLILSGLGLS